MIGTSMRWQTGFQDRWAAGQEDHHGERRGTVSKWGRTEEEAGGREPPAATLGCWPCCSIEQSCPGRDFSISTSRKIATGQEETGVFVRDPEKTQVLRNLRPREQGARGSGPY